MIEILDLKVGWNCNNNCVHCVVADKRHLTNQQDFTLNQIKKFVLENPAQEIVLTGGEATLRNDFLSICEFIKSRTNSKIMLQTNGRRLEDVNFCNEASQYIDTFIIAVHSYSEETHDIITQKKGSWGQTINGIINLLNTYPRKICTQTVISKQNMHTLYKTAAFFGKLGVTNSTITFPHAMGNAWQYFDYVVPQYKDLRPEIKAIIENCNNNYIRFSAIPACELYPHINFMKEALREYHPRHGENNELICMELCDISGENFYNRILGDFAKPEICCQCVLNKKCLGIWREYATKYKDNIDLIPIKENIL